LGATPVFVDIDDVTFNIDSAQLEIAIQAIISNDRTHPVFRGLKNEKKLIPKAIIPVDLFGQPADYDTILAIADKHNLFVIEDGAQAFGATYREKKACGLSDIGCTSFYPSKPLGCYGDGGMCFTDRDDIHDILRSLRSHGQGGDKYNNIRVGINGRMDSFQAAVLLEKLAIFNEELIERNRIANNYNILIDEKYGLQLPTVLGDRTSTWAQYSLLASSKNHRERLLTQLRDDGIPTAVYYPIPLHLQDAFRRLGYEAGDFPVSEKCAERIFSIPMHPYLFKNEQGIIADSINRAGKPFQPVQRPIH